MSLSENLHNLKIYYTNNDYSVSYLIGHVTQKVKVIDLTNNNKIYHVCI